MRVVRGIGLIWGIVSLCIGIVSSFTFNSIHLVESSVVLLSGFLSVLPITIFAIWKPKTAASLLALSICIAVGSVCMTEGFHDGGVVALKLGTPNLIVILLYWLFSKKRPDDLVSP